MKLIFELAVQDANVNATLKQLRADLAAINKQLETTDENSEAFVKLNQEVLETKFLIGELTKAQKLLQKEFAESQLPTDSLAALRLEYSRLVTQVSYFSDAERKSEFGQQTIKQTKELKDRINEIEQSVGNFTGSVGNYKEGILSAAEALGQFGGSLGQQAQILQQAASIFEITTQLGGKFVESVRSSRDALQENLASFRQYVSELRDSKKASDDAAKSQSDVANAAEAVASDSADAGKGLAESAKGATLFSRASNVLSTVLKGLGIGLVIALIVGLIGVFQRFAPVVDFVERVVSGLSAAFDVLVSRAAKVVTALGKFFTGDFSGAFDDVADAVSGIGSAMFSAATAAAALTKELQDLQDAQKDFELQSARTETQIAKLNTRLTDTTKGTKERLAIASQLTKLETDNLNQRTALIDKEIDIERRKLLLNGQITKEQADQIASGNFVLARQLEDEFKLQSGQTDRIQELLVSRANSETNSIRLLELTRTRRNKIIEDAAEKEKQAAEKEQKIIEAQIARIIELQKSIRDLDASTIINDFDRESVEIENKRAEALAKVGDAREKLIKKIAEQKGVLTEADKQELALISEQTASINAAYDEQSKKTEKARERALDAQKQELIKISGELTQLATQNAEKLAQAESELLNTDFSQKQAELLAVLNERKRALTEQLADGAISQKKFKDETLAAQEAFNVGSLQLERERSNKIKEVVEGLRDARINAAKAELAVRLAAIQADFDATITAIREKELAEGKDSSQEIEAAKLRVIEQRKEAELNFSKTVVDATQEQKNAQLAAINEVRAADQKVHEDKLVRLEEERKKRKELQSALLEAAGTVAGAIFEIERNRIDQQKDAAIAALDTEFAKRREAAAGNTAQLEKIEAEYQKRKEAIEKEAARKRKRNAIIEAVIQGALAVVKALPNLVLAALTAVATAAQIAVISSQNFASGGIAQFRKSGVFGGKRHAQGGTKGVFDDGTQIEVERDELFVILNRRASAELRKLSAFNAKHGGRRFADGGLLDFTPQFGSTLDGTSGGSVFVVAEFTDEQIDVLSGRIADRTGAETRKAVVAGLDDRNRTAERQTVMDTNREV
jgi:hypothetical protein